MAELLAGRKLLVVLDNVWERAVLDAFPADRQILFISRSIALARDVQAMPVEVAELDQAASSSEEPWLCPSAGALTTPYGPLRITLRHHAGAVSTVALSADGRVVSGGYDATVRVWELDSGRETVRWTGDSQITACATSVGASQVLAIGESRGTSARGSTASHATPPGNRRCTFL